MISYEFQGHDLTQWAEFGGLPVVLEDISSSKTGFWDERLIAHCDKFFHLLNGDRHDLPVVEKSRFICKLRYSKHTDPKVIEQKPEWAEWFCVVEGLGFFFEAEIELNDVWDYWTNNCDCCAPYRVKRIDEHLFKPEDYRELVRIDE